MIFLSLSSGIVMAPFYATIYSLFFFLFVIQDAFSSCLPAHAAIHCISHMFVAFLAQRLSPSWRCLRANGDVIQPVFHGDMLAAAAEFRVITIRNATQHDFFSLSFSFEDLRVLNVRKSHPDVVTNPYAIVLPAELRKQRRTVILPQEAAGNMSCGGENRDKLHGTSLIICEPLTITVVFSYRMTAMVFTILRHKACLPKDRANRIIHSLCREPPSEKQRIERPLLFPSTQGVGQEKLRQRRDRDKNIK
jgi:hypothetical protein